MCFSGSTFSRRVIRLRRATTSWIRSSASAIAAMRSSHRAPPLPSRANSWTSPETTVSGLLISWAAATARLATERRAVASRSAASARFSSVTSRPIAEAPMMAPSASRRGDTVTDTWTRRPSLRTRTVSYGSTCSPRLSRVRTWSSSFGRSGGTSIDTG